MGGFSSIDHIQRSSDSDPGHNHRRATVSTDLATASAQTAENCHTADLGLGNHVCTSARNLFF